MAGSSPVALFGLARLQRNPNLRRLENWCWRERIAFVSHGVQTVIQVTEPAALMPIRLRLPPGSRETENLDAGPAYSLVVGNEIAPCGLAGLYLLFRGGTLISAAYKLEPVLGALESELDSRVAALAAPERIFIRAGVVGWRGRAILIIGPARQSGTSTLVAALLRAGASYYSDKYAVLDLDGRVRPYACPIWLLAGARAAPVRYRAEELGAPPGTQALEIGTALFASYRAGARSWFVPLAQSAAVEDLTANIVSAQPYRPETQLALRKALAGGWLLMGVRGEADDMVKTLLGAGAHEKRDWRAPAITPRPSK
jgi:hypothetical protein